jgi:hypothetical protein
MKRTLALLTLALLASAHSGCRRATVTFQTTPDGLRYALSTNLVHVGDSYFLEAQLSHPTNTTVDWPRLGDGKKIVVADQGFDRLDHTTSVARWSLRSYELGEHVVWSGQVAVVDGQGIRTERALPVLSVQVQSILPEAGEQLRKAKDLAHWPRPPMTKFMLALGLIGLLALLLGLLVRWWLGRRIRMEAPPPAIPAHEKALAALAALEQRTDFGRADAELFFVEVSSIVRRYVEDRFQLRAPEQTTEEFIRTTSTSSLLSNDHKRLMEDFLVESDLVKFARHRPGADRMKHALGAAYRLVRETIPAPIPPGGAS